MIWGWGSRAIVQCHANIVAGLRFYGFPALRSEDWLSAQRDRNIVRLPSGFVTYLLTRLMGEGGFARDPGDFHHFHGPTATGSWRECVPFTSMHIVAFENGTAEIHYDLCNPSGGVIPVIGHGLECLFPGPTNPFRVARGLKRRDIDVVMVEET